MTELATRSCQKITYGATVHPRSWLVNDSSSTRPPICPFRNLDKARTAMEDIGPIESHRTRDGTLVLVVTARYSHTCTVARVRFVEQGRRAARARGAADKRIALFRVAIGDRHKISSPLTSIHLRHRIHLSLNVRNLEQHRFWVEPRDLRGRLKSAS